MFPYYPWLPRATWRWWAIKIEKGPTLNILYQTVSVTSLEGKDYLEYFSERIKYQGLSCHHLTLLDYHNSIGSLVQRNTYSGWCCDRVPSGTECQGDRVPSETECQERMCAKWDWVSRETHGHNAVKPRVHGVRDRAVADLVLLGSNNSTSWCPRQCCTSCWSPLGQPGSWSSSACQEPR